MNIFEVFKELEKDDSKCFCNGWHVISFGNKDSYEINISNIVGEYSKELDICVSNWREIDKGFLPKELL